MIERQKNIDILRGIAIFTMIAANMASHNLIEPHPFVFRLYGSLAAPMFVFLSGMMVSFTLTIKKYPFTYYFKRFVAIILVAALMDVFIWQIIPFITYDVLYVIAFSMLFIYFLNSVNPFIVFTIVILIFSFTPFLQDFYGYQAYPVEVETTNLDGVNWLKIPVLKQMFVDGWFPFFPWLGVGILGGLIGRFIFTEKSKKVYSRLTIVGSILMAYGIFCWYLFKPEILTRDGYSELFYPPTLIYFSTFLGFIFLLFPITKKVENNKLINLLSVYGKSSLLVYILHSIFIVLVFSLFPAKNMIGFIGLYLSHAIALWFICYAVQSLTKGKKLPFALKIIVGG